MLTQWINWRQFWGLPGSGFADPGGAWAALSSMLTPPLPGCELRCWCWSSMMCRQSRQSVWPAWTSSRTERASHGRGMSA